MNTIIDRIVVALGFRKRPPKAMLTDTKEPDYSHITSRELAVEASFRGELFKILLFPAELGGQDIAANVTYVPEGIPEMKDLITGTLARYFEEDLIDRLDVRTEYKGESFVPSRIQFIASHTTKKGVFRPSISIW